MVADATARTHRWAERCLAAHTRPDQALFGIVQGGLEPDLRAESDARSSPGCRSTASASAGWPATRRRQQRRAALDVVVPLLADDPRPRYLMGLGSPLDLLDAVDAGVDMFDSRAAGAGRAQRPAVGARWPAQPAQRALPRRSAAGPGGLSAAALCRSFSRAYLAHLFRADELLAYRLATCHNLTFTLDFMARIRPRSGPGPSPCRTRCAGQSRWHARVAMSGGEVDGAVGVKPTVRPRLDGATWRREDAWPAQVPARREAKKKPKAKPAKPKLESLSDAARRPSR